MPNIELTKSEVSRRSKCMECFEEINILGEVRLEREFEEISSLEESALDSGELRQVMEEEKEEQYRIDNG